MPRVCPGPVFQTRASRANWTEPGVLSALVWLSIDDLKGNPLRGLPPALYSHAIAPFLHFDAPLPNQLYAVGGRNQQRGPLETMEMFDTWHGRWVACPNMAVRRAGCAAAALPDQRMLVVGGYDENGIVKGLLTSCELFDPRTQTWSSEVVPLKRARWGHGCATLGGFVYVAGGCSLQPGAPPREAFMETLRSCEVYDPAADVWLPCADLHMARAGSRVVALGDHHLAAVGGCDDVFGRAEMLPTVEIFDLATARWSLLDLQLSTPRTTAAVAPLDDHTILVVGGAPSLSSAEVYHVPRMQLTDDDDSIANPVSEHSPTVHDIPEGRMGCQAVAMQLPAEDGRYPLCTKQYVVVIGGENGDDDWEHDQANVRQFGSALVFDVERNTWREDAPFPPMLTPRTAMALCVGHGRIQGYPSHTRRAGCMGGG